jgi:hypothetical protein
LPNSLRVIRLSPASSAQGTNQREALVRAKVTAEQSVVRDVGGGFPDCADHRHDLMLLILLPLPHISDLNLSN